MGFEEEYQAFLKAHLQARTGERLRRLQEYSNEDVEKKEVRIEMGYIKELYK